MLRKLFFILVIIGLLATALNVSDAPNVKAQSGATAVTNTELNVRTGPGTNHAVVTQLPPNTTLIVDGKNAAGDWLMVHTSDGAISGWVAVGFLSFPNGIDINALPVTDGSIAANPSAPQAPAPEGSITATTKSQINVRTGPGVSFARVISLPFGTTVILQGRNHVGDWLFVGTTDGAIEGWVATGLLNFPAGLRIPDLPVMVDVVVTGPDEETDLSLKEAEEAYFASLPPGDPRRNNTTGIAEPAYTGTTPLSGAVLGTARRIFLRGQRAGNDPGTFIKIGDSNSAGTVFLCPFHYGQYDLGGYGYLQDTINFFQGSGSFCGVGHLTAQTGFSTAHLLDPLWSDPAQCQANESPLQCEYRLRKPSIAVIYIGLADMATLPSSVYRSNLYAIVNFLTTNGVVPILTTYPMADAYHGDKKIPTFNNIIREVARARNVPLIDLRAATLSFPDRGVGPDGYHLSYGSNDWTYFVGEENIYGRTLRELLTLQVMHELRAAFY